MNGKLINGVLEELQKRNVKKNPMFKTSIKRVSILKEHFLKVTLTIKCSTLHQVFNMLYGGRLQKQDLKNMKFWHLCFTILRQ